MIIIGEKLNSSIPKTFEALKCGNEEYIMEIAIAQEKAGADYLDLNTAMFMDEELDMMLHLVDIVQKKTSCGIMIDSPKPYIVENAISKIDKRNVIINSITLNERFNELIPIAKEYNTGIVGLPIDEDGVPKDCGKRTKNALKLVDICTSKGIKQDKIYIDILAETISVENNGAVIALQTANSLRCDLPDVHLICGLSNVSFGLPKRVYINSAFLTNAIFAGVDSAIMDITSENTRNALYASLAVAGKDDFCLNYIKNSRL